ncbi:MAG: hypothetical protein P8163_18155 [Candidatus Thiodiazotropha sp.]
MLQAHQSGSSAIEGIPLGKQLQEGTRKGKRQRRHLNNNVSEKENQRWITEVEESQSLDVGNTEVIHIADRECDFYEFFRDASALGDHVLIRAARNRSINKDNRRAKPEAHLFDYLKNKHAKGKITINLESMNKIYTVKLPYQ